ncbi:MAG TPA: MBL fold metallo-hydrolase [Blastocatellia bacterium]|nr:MBL fold metallo-hydrolase [Blastocatellia bacterium]
MQLQEIASDVYACLQPDHGLGWSNSGLINRGGGLVVDTFWDLPHTRELIENYSRVWKAPARRLVNTHHNGDHCWGNQLFPEAEIIGHRNCAANFDREQPQVLQMLRNAIGSDDPAIAALAHKLAEWDFSDIEPVPPTTLIDERLELNLDGIPVHLIHVGPAHTSGDVILHLPGQRVVFAGDVLFRLCTPIGWDGTFEGWMNALDVITALDPEVIVPGHGPLCGLEGPRELKAYLAYVRAEARGGFDAGLSALETAKRIDLGPYARWTEPERLLFSVERAYREFCGKPFDAPIDAVAVFREMHQLRSDPHFGRH